MGIHDDGLSGSGDRATYQVIKREVAASVNGEACGFNVLRYYATFYGREPVAEDADADPYLEVWKDNSITLHHRGLSIFLYRDQWLGIVAAFETALRDQREAKTAAVNAWLAETANATVFHGVRVDLTRTQVIDALTSSVIEVEDRGQGRGTKPIIVFNGELHNLCRTDLFDDVATCLSARKTADEWREYYLCMARKCLGGRIVSSQGNRRFSVIDALSDG